MVEGRTSQVVHLPDGSAVHPFAVWAPVKLLDGVVRYQLVQHEPGRFELRLVTVDRATFDSVAARVAAELEAILRGATVEPSYHQRLEQGRGGKFSPVVALPRG